MFSEADSNRTLALTGCETNIHPRPCCRHIQGLLTERSKILRSHALKPSLTRVYTRQSPRIQPKSTSTSPATGLQHSASCACRKIEPKRRTRTCLTALGSRLPGLHDEMRGLPMSCWGSTWHVGFGRESVSFCHSLQCLHGGEGAGSTRSMWWRFCIDGSTTLQFFCMHACLIILFFSPGYKCSLDGQ